MGQSEGSTDLFDILLVSPSQPALGRDTMTGPYLVFHYLGPVVKKGKTFLFAGSFIILRNVEYIYFQTAP